MKNEAYRNMMVTYWKKHPDKRIPGMVDETWDMHNVKILILAMLSTAYNLILEKGVCKVACWPRYCYLSHIFTNYPKWFQDSKCSPDADFLKEYKQSLIQEEVDEQSFSGMWTKYVNVMEGSVLR
jgi:L-lysine 2,3-aminomutase